MKDPYNYRTVRPRNYHDIGGKLISRHRNIEEWHVADFFDDDDIIEGLITSPKTAVLIQIPTGCKSPQYVTKLMTGSESIYQHVPSPRLSDMHLTDEPYTFRSGEKHVYISKAMLKRLLLLTDTQPTKEESKSKLINKLDDIEVWEFVGQSTIEYAKSICPNNITIIGYDRTNKSVFIVYGDRSKRKGVHDKIKSISVGEIKQYKNCYIVLGQYESVDDVDVLFKEMINTRYIKYNPISKFMMNRILSKGECVYKFPDIEFWRFNSKHTYKAVEYIWQTRPELSAIMAYNDYDMSVSMCSELGGQYDCRNKEIGMVEFLNGADCYYTDQWLTQTFKQTVEAFKILTGLKADTFPPKLIENLKKICEQDGECNGVSHAECIFSSIYDPYDKPCRHNKMLNIGFPDINNVDRVRELKYKRAKQLLKIIEEHDVKCICELMKHL